MIQHNVDGEDDTRHAKQCRADWTRESMGLIGHNSRNREIARSVVGSVGADSNLLLPHPVQFCTFSASPIPICIATNPLCYLLLGPKICNNEEGSRNSLTEMQDEKWSGHFGGEFMKWSLCPTTALRRSLSIFIPFSN